jgi:zinc transporter, ZIP family
MRVWPSWTPRRALGALVAAGGAWALLPLPADPALAAALRGGLVAAAATALGALPVVFSQQLSARVSDALLGFGAGVMLAASAFSLVVPGLRAARDLGHGTWGAGGIVAAGIVLGALFLLWASRHAEQSPRLARHEPALRGAWLFVAAIALHNLPEGLAIGVAVGGGAEGARALVTGIAIQDVPEGLVVALALRAAGHGRGAAFGLGAASGLFEPLAALAGAAALSVSLTLLPWGLAFAAGAMLFAVSHHVIPGAHAQGNARLATGGLIAGYVLMATLDNALG